MARTYVLAPETKTLRWRRQDLVLGAHEWAVYRLYDQDRRLLYVGMTGDPIERWRRHAQRKPWWCDVRSISFELHPTKDAALAVELVAIRSEAPAYNKAGVA